MSTEARSIVSEKFMLNLDGVECGYVQSLTIGGITTNVTSPPARPTHHAKKHPGPPKSEDIEMQIGLSMTQPVYDWIAATWTGNYLRKSGSVIGTDFGGVAVSERDFVDALITEVSVPAMDASVMDACFMNLKFSPKRATSKKGDGKVIGPFKELPKIWLSSNFQLTIDGLDCTKVNKIDSFTVNAINTLSTIGESRDPQSVPTQLVFPNLTITLAEISAQSWFDWYKDFVINGNNGLSNEKGGTLTFLAPDLKTELAHINFFNLSILKIAPDVTQTNNRRVTAELSCGRMEFVCKV